MTSLQMKHQTTFYLHFLFTKAKLFSFHFPLPWYFPISICRVEAVSMERCRVLATLSFTVRRSVDNTADLSFTWSSSADMSDEAPFTWRISWDISADFCWTWPISVDRLADRSCTEDSWPDSVARLAVSSVELLLQRTRTKYYSER